MYNAWSIAQPDKGRVERTSWSSHATTISSNIHSKVLRMFTCERDGRGNDFGDGFTPGQPVFSSGTPCHGHNKPIGHVQEDQNRRYVLETPHEDDR